MVKSSEFRGVTLFKPTAKWRAQISAGGKTTSLGDHDSEAEAARAFDRAAINKAGSLARTNFPLEDYAAELEDLKSMPQAELVAMLRSRARKSGTQTSHYRGVSLLKQTGKWHAQINVGGKQVHLGFFATEQLAARAYDRAAINKGARDGGKIITNFDICDYKDELDYLRRIPQDQLVSKLSKEDTRKGAMELLANGFTDACSALFPIVRDEVWAAGLPTIDALISKAERAAPKPTAKDPLYPNFGKSIKKEIPKTPEKLEHRAAANADAPAHHHNTRGHHTHEPRRESAREHARHAAREAPSALPQLPQYSAPYGAALLARMGAPAGLPMLFANVFTEFVPKGGGPAGSHDGPLSPPHSHDHSAAQHEDGRVDGRSSVLGARRSAKRRLVDAMGTPSPNSSNDGPYSYPEGAAADDEHDLHQDASMLLAAASGALEAASAQRSVLATPPRGPRGAPLGPLGPSYLGLTTPSKLEAAVPRYYEDVEVPLVGPHVGPRSARKPRAVVRHPAVSDSGSQHQEASEDEMEEVYKKAGKYMFEHPASPDQRKNRAPLSADTKIPLSRKRYSPWRRNYSEDVSEDEAESQGAKEASEEERMPSRKRKSAPARAAVA